ncbi:MULTISPECIES: exopolysaccharide biosynthesis polyprenyl glycosylphosphotransferase [Streptomyces]|uniref:Exopolysaccharide biosynthesis polyprenyl glycosylphosphotransferase n=1 Tax=Streptomyces harbinensis TaxID=1176198 RepID=A0A1I6T0G7_9ACTN|nr:MULTISPECIES: exopolysaccharide biosynthesis polyprenyl glycosylphosphotransferase [Streptomyces]SFS82517.1 exopolysaccharide biosynthesis polyprenyl glycosylphosphotransferase [Streptomyces harbinensis]
MTTSAASASASSTSPNTPAAPAPVAVPAPAGRRPGRPPAAGARRRWRPGVAGLLLGADVLAVVLAAVFGGGLLHGLVVLAVLLALNAWAGLYRPTPMAAALDELPRLAGHGLLGWLVSGGGLAFLLVPLLAAAGRGAVHQLRRAAVRERPRRTLVVGTGTAARRVAAMLAEHPEYGMRPAGPVDPDRLDAALGGVRAVVFTRAQDDTTPLRRCWERGVTVWLVDPEPPLWFPAAATHLWGYTCRRLDPPERRPPGADLLKRTVDIAGSGLALLLAAPVLGGCALAVRLADGPGVLFRQERIGKDGKPFTMLKFRTLRPDTEQEAATRWTIAGDHRMSPVGRLLRRTSLDELPQLWNVLRGDMSLVGPRPERPHFVDEFSRTYPGYADRHRMPVGLTGLAQVSGLRGDTSIEDRTRFDNLYIETWSLWADLRIMLRTTASCFRLGGS